MPSIYQVNARFWVPTQAAMAIMRQVFAASCAGCPISVGGEPPDPVINLSGYDVDIEITDGTTFVDVNPDQTDFVELNAEAAPPYCDGHLEGPVIDPETGLATIIVDEHVITSTSGLQYFGAAIWTDFGDGNVLLGVSRFPVAIGSGEVGDVFKISGPWSLCACVPGS